MNNRGLTKIVFHRHFQPTQFNRIFSRNICSLTFCRKPLGVMIRQINFINSTKMVLSKIWMNEIQNKFQASESFLQRTYCGVFNNVSISIPPTKTISNFIRIAIRRCIFKIATRISIASLGSNFYKSCIWIKYVSNSYHYRIGSLLIIIIIIVNVVLFKWSIMLSNIKLLMWMFAA